MEEVDKKDVYFSANEQEMKKAFEKVFDNVNSLIGVERSVGNYKLNVSDSYDVIAEQNTGASVVFPLLSSSWEIMMSWISRWDDSSKISVETYLDKILFPCINLIANSDEQYIEEISTSNINLYKRIGVSDDYKIDMNTVVVVRDLFKKMIKQASEE